MQSIMKTKFNISISKKESFYLGIILLILATGGFFLVGAALFFTSLKISKTTKEK